MALHQLLRRSHKQTSSLHHACTFHTVPIVTYACSSCLCYASNCNLLKLIMSVVEPQGLPMCLSVAASLGVLMMIYAIGSPVGTTAFETTPQGTCVIMTAVGIGACLIATMLVPFVSRRMSRRMPVPVPIKRMNLLGLVRNQGASWL